jgi:hypothetical protein
MAYGSIAISDNGTGTIVGWTLNNNPNAKRAVKRIVEERADGIL